MKPAMRYRKGLESSGTEGDTPVRDVSWRVITSRAGHVVSCLNTGGPSSKAEYYLTTDSEPVP